MSPSASDSSLKIFISYSHKDAKDKDKLETHLQVVDELELWTDTRIGAGQDWRQEIDDALNQAAAVVLLITANFLASQFIKTKEVPKILVRRKNEGLSVFPIIARQCPWKLVSWLESMQIRPERAKPVWRSGGRHADDELTLITYEVANAVKWANINRRPEMENAAEKTRAAQAFAAERKRVEEDVQQKRAGLLEAENRRNQIERWRILQDTRAKILEIQSNLSEMKLEPQDAMYRKWSDYIHSA